MEGYKTLFCSGMCPQNMFVTPGLFTVTTLSYIIACLTVQSSVDGVAHTSNKCDISTSFVDQHENI